MKRARYDIELSMESETNDSIGLQTARFAAFCNRLCYYGSLTTDGFTMVKSEWEQLSARLANVWKKYEVVGVTLGAHENIVKVPKLVVSKGKQTTTLGEGVKAERKDPRYGECKQAELSFMPRRCA